MLYLVSTPIGNLGDITVRSAETLSACDEIWCEDTRHTAGLLEHLGIKKPLVSCHEHTEKSRAALLVQKLSEGKNVAYVSDAGMPGISDPGALLVRACIEADLPYTVLPGPCAAVTAGVLSGLSMDRFTFFGFLPRTGKERREALEAAAGCGHTAILYESPHRVHDTLCELRELTGDCPAVLCRELTKLHETAHRGTMDSLIAETARQEVRGECVLVIEVPVKAEETQPQDLDALLISLMAHMSVKDAVSEAVSALKLPKKQVYARALELAGKRE